MEEIALNKNIYTLEIIFSASYLLLEKAYFMFDEDDSGNILVRIDPKKEGPIINEFKDTLVACLNNKNQADNTKEIRTMILQRALLLFDGENRQER